MNTCVLIFGNDLAKECLHLIHTIPLLFALIFYSIQFVLYRCSCHYLPSYLRFFIT